MRHAWVCFATPLVTTVGSLTALVAVGVAGWPGERGVAAMEFCEGFRSGPIGQPVNTFSNAGFFLVSLVIGWRAWRDGAAVRQAGWSNPLVDNPLYAASYAAIGVAIGAGSSAYHAATTRWSAELDLLALHLWGGWCLAYAGSRLVRGGDRAFVSMALGIGGMLVARVATRYPTGLSGAVLFGAMVVGAISLEVVGRYRNRRWKQSEGAHLAAAIGVFVVAFGCWIASRTDGPWCDPVSPWQGHAVWHVLCSGSVWLVYLYGRSERAAATCEVDGQSVGSLRTSGGMISSPDRRS